MVQILVHEKLKHLLRDGVSGIEANQTIRLLLHRILHLHGAGVVGGLRAKLKLTRTAIGNVASRPPVGGSIAHGVHDGGQRSHAVAVDTTVSLHLHLLLNAAQLVGDGVGIVETLGILCQPGNDHGIVLVAIHKLKQSIATGFGVSGEGAVKHSAIDALGTILLVD